MPDDTNAWRIFYPPTTVAWLYDWVDASGGLSVLDALRIDEQYPDLLKDLDTFAWMVALLQKQVASESNP